MTEDPHSDLQDRPKNHKKLWTALAVVTLVVALLVVPPLVSINRYKSRITQLVSASLDRPVRLSGVELRLLPRPGFVFTDLTVQEDPAFTAEPVLHANTVVASIRLLPLWRGQLQLSRISVDEASLNLVRAADGRWNIDALFHTAAARQHPTGGEAIPIPYMEATNSRINVKDGTEKLPFSLVDADASLWQESGGAWRVRLKGQPVRTDVSLDMADTGIVLLEATLHPAARLEQMPLHLDLDWQDAQLGQLSRLLLGSDEGWRGDLRGELHLDGTVDSAQVKSRLRATGVHRVEFAPAAPLDFDATCGFVFHSADRSAQSLQCDSPIGGGRARLTGDVPGGAGSPDLSLDLDRIPAQAGLDLLRTLRSDLDPGLQAAGSVSGKLRYQRAEAPASTARPAKKAHAAKVSAPASRLDGSLTVLGLSVSGGALSKPVQISKLVLEPAAGVVPGLAASFPVTAGAPAPLAVTARVDRRGFEVGIHGAAALPQLRELAQAAGFAQVQMLAQLAGEPALLDVHAEGPWLSQLAPSAGPGTGTMTGTITLHDANWKAGFLASPVLLPSASLHIEDGTLRWDPVTFAFGPVKGTATLTFPPACDAPQACAPQFTVHFASLDAAALQAALLGAQHRGTLLGSLLERLNASSPQPWPRMDGELQADSLELGPFALERVIARLKIRSTGVEATGFQADALGGRVSGTGSMTLGDKPGYKVDGEFVNLSAAKVGQLFGMKWTGGAIEGNTKLALAGYFEREISSSATGTVHFDWRHGSVVSVTGTPVPTVLAKFDRWTADAAVAKGAITLQQNEVLRGAMKLPVEGAAQFGTPAPVSFGSPAGVSEKPSKPLSR